MKYGNGWKHEGEQGSSKGGGPHGWIYFLDTYEKELMNHYAADTYGGCFTSCWHADGV